MKRTEADRHHSKPTHRNFARIFAVLLFALLSLHRPAPLHPQTSPSAARQEQPLDGPDWLLGSFPMDAGIAAGAQAENFDESGFRRVQVPGEVQLQLGLKGMELFRQTKELTAINQKEWWYRKHFRVPPPATGKTTLLEFDGADYFATVWLNGKLLGQHEGTYVPFSFDVTSLLRHDADNVLSIRLTHPWIPKGRGLDEYIKGNFTMTDYSDTATLNHPPYVVDAGWDALPAHGNAAFSMGLWRSVHLTTRDAVTLGNLYVRTESIQPDGSALLTISGEVENASPQPAQTTIDLSIAPANFTGETLKPEPIPVRATPGKTHFSTHIRVENAHLWWTWDSGPQNMYKLSAQILPSGNAASPSDSQSVRFGIRTLTRDANMTTRLNGKRIFIKASWFPIADYYGSRPTHDTYDRDLRLFRDANLNLVVNFTVVEKPPFYELCDELGILIVAEMPFPQFGPGGALAADSPRRQPFLEEAAKEMTQIVTGLRNHPSIIEWAPLAESHVKGGGWGEEGFPFDQSGYQAFSDEMRKLVADLSPGTVFHPSLCDFGEQHFWYAEAGGGRDDSGDYQDHFDAQTGFVSEYGGISMSSFEKLNQYLTPKEQWDQADRTMPRWFQLPIDISSYSYLTSSEYDGLYNMLYRSSHWVDQDIRSPRELVDDTQLYQAFLLKYATEAYRRKKYDPIMGIRFWDFLELAPGFRFGMVDYDHIPKVSYWWMKRAQAKLAVSLAYKDALESQVAGSKLSIPVWAVSDLDHAVDAKVECNVYDVRGNKVFNQSFAAQIPVDGKAQVGKLDWTLPDQPGVYLLRTSLTSSRQEDRASNTTFVKVVPRAFSRPLRVLLIAQSKVATPIAALLRGAGIDVDLRDEDAVGRFDELAGVDLHSKYDVIWLATFENFAKLLPANAAESIKQAVAAGTGFIHTGGDGSYHGGQARESLIELTPLADLLPVAIQNRNDLIYGQHTLDDTLQTEPGFKDIAAAHGEEWPGLPLLQKYGIPAFNQVTAKTDSRTILRIHDQPLLVTGKFGQGRTVSFTGFTPVHSEKRDHALGQQIIRDPAYRAYFQTFISLVALSTGRSSALPVDDLLAAMEKPLFQTLKEQPTTQIRAQLETGKPATDPANPSTLVQLKNGTSYAHLVRLRMEWDSEAPEPYLTEFDDNAFELLPGEQKTVLLSWRMSPGASSPSGTLIIDGANVEPLKIRVQAQPGNKRP